MAATDAEADGDEDGTAASGRQGPRGVDGSEASVFQTLEQMAEHEIGAPAVIEDGRLVGLVSERDYARKVIFKGYSPGELEVRDIMASRVIRARPNESPNNAWRS